MPRPGLTEPITIEGVQIERPRITRNTLAALERGPVPQTQYLSPLARSTAYGYARDLIHRGLAQRDGDPRSRRAATYQLTELGRRVLAALRRMEAQSGQ